MNIKLVIVLSFFFGYIDSYEWNIPRLNLISAVMQFINMIDYCLKFLGVIIVCNRKFREIK